jgi:hypothetical protein
MVGFLFPFRLVVSSFLSSSVNVNGDTAAFTEEEGDSMVYSGASLFPVIESSGDDNNITIDLISPVKFQVTGIREG